MAIPNAERKRRRRGLFDFEIQQFGEIDGVIVLGMKNGGAGFEGLAGDCDGGHPASYDAVSFEDVDLADERWRGVVAEEVGDG